MVRVVRAETFSVCVSRMRLMVSFINYNAAVVCVVLSYDRVSMLRRMWAGVVARVQQEGKQWAVAPVFL